MTAVKEMSDKRLEDAKKTASPVDDALFQITSTLANLMLALVGSAQTQTAGALPHAVTNAELARLQA